MGHAVENTVDALRVARIDLEAAIVLKVSAEVVNVHALRQTGNVNQIFVGIAGSVVVMVLLLYQGKEVMIMNVEL